MRFARALVGVTAMLIAAAGCGGGSSHPEVAGSPGEGWRQLTTPPLSPRTDAVVVGVGEEMLVVGGWEFLCPPGADCATPDGPLFDDGAVYDAEQDEWRLITSPPFGLRSGDYATATLAGSAYILTSCEAGPECGARPRLISYDVVADTWTDHGIVPGPTHYRHLQPFGKTLLVYAGSDEGGEVSDFLFDPRQRAWTALPDDPLPRTFDRFMVAAGEHVVLSGSPLTTVDDGEDSPTLAARLDVMSQEWSALPDAPGSGYQLLPTSSGAVLNGHYIDSPGWVLDAGSWTWSELPGGLHEDRDLSGVLMRDRAVYDTANSVGQVAARGAFVYDAEEHSYVSIPPFAARRNVSDDSTAALGRDLFVFGGQRWTGDAMDGTGELRNDAWLWTAPE